MQRRWVWVGEVGLVAVVLAAAVLTFTRAKAKTDGDEAEWIGTSRYFVSFFVDRDFSAETWADNYWTRTQPMMARYVIGAWLWSRGYDLKSFDPNYNHDVSWAANQRAGRAPTNALLDESRIPMRALAALSVVAAYLIVILLVGPIGGLVTAGLFLGSPYLSEHLIRSKGDTTLMAFVLLGVLCGVLSLRGNRSPRLGWSVLAGVALGLAVGAKLTGILALFAVPLWGLLSVVQASSGQAGAEARSGAQSGVPRGALAPGMRWAIVVVVTAALAFVASNPFLYPDPVGRFGLMLENRNYEMSVQAATEPYKAVTSPIDRVTLAFERGLLHETWGMSYVGLPIEAALAAVGVAWLGIVTFRRGPSAEAYVLMTFVCLFAGVSWGLGYRQQHYFLPCALAGVIVAGVGAGALFSAVCKGVERAIAHVRRQQRRTPGPERPSIAEPLAAKG